MYRFFAQPQVDQARHRIFGYEVLLRQQKRHVWVLPASFTAISVPDQARLLQQTATALNVATTNQRLAFNLNRQQFQDPQTLTTIVKLKHQLGTVPLVIELTEAPKLSELIPFSATLHRADIQLGLDDVGTGVNTYHNVKSLLPCVDEIKFAMQNFRAQHKPAAIQPELTFWTKVAREHHLEIILEGIETGQDQALAHHYGITLHQGYLYGKPALVTA